MFKAKGSLAIVVLFLFVVVMGSCGGGGGGGGGGGTGTTPPTTQGDLSQYSAGDIEDPNFNGIGIDEGVQTSSIQNKIYNLVEIQGVCDPEGIGYKNFCKNNCTEWVAKRRDERGDALVIWRGNGGQWLANAAAVNYETGTTPKVGAIAVFKLSYDPCPGTDTCNKLLYLYGHVAYVESVEKDINGIVTKWTISEYNYDKNKPDPETREFFSVTISDKQAPALIGFIYGPKTLPNSDTVPPSTPIVLTGNAISSSRINLSWTASTDNIGVAGYKIYRSGYYLKSVPTAYTSDTGLSPSTGYCYTVSAYDAANNESGKSNQACATTLTTSDTTPPSIPTGLSATAVSSSQINLSWNVSTDNVGVTGYKIYDYYGTYLKSANTTSTSFTGLNPNTYYCFTVSAYDAAGNESGQSNQACATTLSTQTFTLSVTKAGTGSGTVTSSPEGINCGVTCSASFNQGATVTLTATPSSGSTFAGWSGACSGTGTCNVTMDSNKSVTATFNIITVITGTINVNAEIDGIPWNGNVDYNITGPITIIGGGVPLSKETPAGTYTLTYTGSGPAGATLSSIAPSSTQTLTSGSNITFTMKFVALQPPNTPSNLITIVYSSSRIALSWQDNSSNELGFVIERKTGINGYYNQIATVTSSGYTDTGLLAGTTYCYRVYAYNNVGSSSYSNEACGTTLPLDYLTGTWQGTWAGSSGNGTMTLVLFRDSDNNLTGNVTFYGHPSFTSSSVVGNTNDGYDIQLVNTPPPVILVITGRVGGSNNSTLTGNYQIPTDLGTFSLSKQ